MLTSEGPRQRFPMGTQRSMNDTMAPAVPGQGQRKPAESAMVVTCSQPEYCMEHRFHTSRFARLPQMSGVCTQF